MDDRQIPQRPAASQAARRLLRPLNRFFDFLYHSEYNPFYRSGTLAIGLLFVLLATGLYLIFFYSVSDPHSSIVRLQDQVWLGRWVRALHRYATDAALIAVFFHVLQLLSQGKTWGPRTLAWLSGVLLLGALFISAWTGYVLVWDRHGQLVALAGARLLRIFPFLHGELGHAFGGDRPLPASFFFMNLFLHVAIPLGMVFGMMIHTARLARTVWFPIRPVFYGTLAALFVLSLLMPAVLLPKADFSAMVGRIPADWFFSFWIPLIDVFSPGAVLGAAGAFALIAFSIPWWWKPPKSVHAPTSQVDVDKCTGCIQCVRDCPYEAIRMVPHPNGKHGLAEVSPALCVSCGICTASCAYYAVGPPGRNSFDQLEQIEAFLSEKLPEQDSGGIVLIGCLHNDSMPGFLSELEGADSRVHHLPINCCGTLHSESLRRLLDRCEGAMLLGCAARNCSNRDGLELLSGRLYQRRVPFLAKDIDSRRLRIAPHSEGEKKALLQELRDFQTYFAGPAAVSRPRFSFSWLCKRTVATAVLLLLIGAASRAPMGSEPEGSMLRVLGRFPSRTATACRKATEEELAKLPAHMRLPEICEQLPLTYRLSVLVDGASRLEQTIEPRGVRSELPILISHDIAIEPGTQRVEATAAPQAKGVKAGAKTLRHSAALEFKRGRIEVLRLE